MAQPCADDPTTDLMIPLCKKDAVNWYSTVHGVYDLTDVTGTIFVQELLGY